MKKQQNENEQRAQELFPDVPCDSADEMTILGNCVDLMDMLMGRVQEWIDLNEIDASPSFGTAFSMFEIVQRLFLGETGHSGGRFTMKKCIELGITDPSKLVWFGTEEEDDG